VNRTGLRTWHLLALLIAGHAPLMLLWSIVPQAFGQANMVAAPLIFALAGLILLAYVLGYSGLGRRIRHPGGLYVQVSQGLGRPAGLGAAALIFVSYIGVSGGLFGLVLVDFRSLVASAFGVQVPNLPALVLGVAAVIAGSLMPLRMVARVLAVIVVEQAVSVLWFDYTAFSHPAGGGTRSLAALDPGWLLSGSFAVALVFAVSSFAGSELGTVYSTETADQGRSLPRATFVSYGVTTILLVISALAVSVNVGPEQTPAAAAQSPDLVAGVAVRLAPSGSGTMVVNLLLLNLLIGAVATGVTLNNAAARLLGGLSQDGLLPRTFAMRPGRPARAAVLVQPIVGGTAALAGLSTATGVLPNWVITAGTLGVIGSLALASAATALWFLRGEADEGGFFGWEGQVAAGVTSVVTTGGLFLYGVFRLRKVVPGAPEYAGWLVGAVLIGAFLAGLAVGLWLRLNRPAGYARIGGGKGNLADVPVAPQRHRHARQY
jgi:amino acid transporter